MTQIIPPSRKHLLRNSLLPALLFVAGIVFVITPIRPVRGFLENSYNLGWFLIIFSVLLLYLFIYIFRNLPRIEVTDIGFNVIQNKGIHKKIKNFVWADIDRFEIEKSSLWYKRQEHCVIKFNQSNIAEHNKNYNLQTEFHLPAGLDTSATVLRDILSAKKLKFDIQNQMNKSPSNED